MNSLFPEANLGTQEQPNTEAASGYGVVGVWYASAFSGSDTLMTLGWGLYTAGTMAAPPETKLRLRALLLGADAGPGAVTLTVTIYVDGVATELVAELTSTSVSGGATAEIVVGSRSTVDCYVRQSGAPVTAALNAYLFGRLEV